jgi:pilus assembly protein CpaB
MNRTTRTLIVVAVATVTAGIASYGVYAAVRSIPVREVEVAHLFVAVATKDLPNGVRLTEKDVKLVAWPSSNPVAGSFSKVEVVVNRGLIVPVQANEPLTESKLAPLEAGAGLPPSIPTGMRAMSVKVDEVIGVAGFVVPGTRVDLLVTLRPVSGNVAQQEPMSRTVLSNLLVLTAGTKLDQEMAKDDKPQKSTVVTLAVLPQDAERIALAASEGKISLALRNPLDTAPTETQGVQVTALMKGRTTAPVVDPAKRRVVVARKAPDEVVLPPVPPAPEVYRVETIRAAKRSQEVID